MFGLGLPEIIVIFVIALIVFGPKKLPDLGKSIGRAIADFKKASEDFQETVRSEMKEVEKTAGVDELKKLKEFDITAHSQPEPEKPPIEQEPTAKPKEKKSGEAKKNV